MNIKHLPSISEKERMKLEYLYKHHPKHYISERAQMVLLSSYGYYMKEIAKILRVHPVTVSKFIRRYKAYGANGLFDRPLYWCKAFFVL